MQYSIEGRNCELLRVALNDGEGVLAEVGKLISMREGVTWNVVLPGHGVAGKLAAGIKRKIGGASVVLTEYAGPGEVGFSGFERPYDESGHRSLLAALRQPHPQRTPDG